MTTTTSVPLPTYAYYKGVFENEKMPLAFVDLDLFDQNIIDIKKRAASKWVRVASKSVRCTNLLKRILDAGVPFQGLMTFTAAESVFLAKQGFDDLLVAYPTWHKNDIADVAHTLKQGKRIVLMVDCKAHVEQLNKVGKEMDVPLLACIDVDMSSAFPGLHFGVHRSPVNEAKKAKKVLKALKKAEFVKLVGLMGYEAQIAGLGDKVPRKKILNTIVQTLKNKSVKILAQRRAEIVALIEKEGFILDFVNGGGTGSLETTTNEACVTEVTVGSGFYNPGLFDNYKNFKHLPAAAYAVEIVRQPKKDVFTCSGGGYTASGTPSFDKAPKPYLPEGVKLTDNEGAGEVQTPIVYKGAENLKLGDPIFLRHSKAGELCERFNELLLVSKGKIVARVPTYRGEGQCFL